MAYATAAFTSANGTTAVVGTSLPSSSSAQQVSTIPAASLVSGDLHTFTGFAGALVGQTMPSARTTTLITSSNSDPTLTLGPDLNAPSVSTFGLQGGVVRVRSAFTIQSQYNSMWLLNYSQSSGGTTRNVTITVSGAYQAQINASQFGNNMPDFSAVPGWQATWGLQNNVLINWMVIGYGWSLGSGLGQPALDGTVILSAFKSGSYTPP